MIASLRFLGAAGEVTGSSTLLRTRQARVLIDFGMHQGGPEAEIRNRRFPIEDPERLDAVVITHAHIDHIGRLPVLASRGCHAPIFATPATCDLTAIMLRDAAHLQERDIERFNRRREATSRPPTSPLYTTPDVERLLPQLVPLPYNEPRQIAPGVSLRFFEAGHILGSASVELTVSDGGPPRTIVFSGDLGQRAMPLLRDPVPPPHADIVILESTYGDRDHRSRAETVSEFASIIDDAAWNKEKVLIPAFAVGRTQMLIYHLGQLARRPNAPAFPVYVDSPMATSVTELYSRHRNLFDDETWAIISDGHSPLNPPDLRFTRSGDESRALNDLWGSALIIAASGMCTGGRILHHLRHNLWRRGVHVVIVGYQSRGTLGRTLVEGAQSVRVLGNTVEVRARIHTLGGFSAHAGRSELLQWLATYKDQKPRVFLNHGEQPQRDSLAAAALDRFGITPEMPSYGQMFEL